MRQNNFKQTRNTIAPPKGAGVLFMTHLFATIPLGTLFSTLILYVTSTLQLTDSSAATLIASFIAFNYILHLLGGYLGNRVLSYRSLFCIAMIVQIIGCILLATPTMSAMYWGLGFFLSGCGFNAVCVNCMLANLFKPDNKQREAAFLWNYSGMNIGFLLGFLISGYLQLSHAYHSLFLLISLANLLALLIVIFKWKLLKNSSIPSQTSSHRRFLSYATGIVIIGALVFALKWLLKHAQFSDNLILFVGLLALLLVLYLAIKQDKQNKNKMLACLIFSLAALLFWAIYQVAPLGLTLFIENNVARQYFNVLIAPQWIQIINTLTIIFGGPILSFIFSTLRTRGILITVPLQFSLALLFIGLSFAILPIGIHFANAQGYSTIYWVLGSYLFQGLGELFLAPIGNALIGKLAPENLQGIMMGVWLMVSGVGAVFSGYLTKMTLTSVNSIIPLVTNVSFNHMFTLLAIMAFVTAGILFLLIPLLLRLIRD